MATTNTTEPITLRGGFVPVLRYGNFAGPGYAGGIGSETRIENPAINNGKPILASELTKTPEGVAQFMQVALKTEPNGYMDSVTRSPDVEYTFAEIRFMDSVKTQFDGKLPHELTAQDKQDPTFKQLESARDGEYWQADQRMLTSVAQYQPTDFVDSSYRAIALTAFYNKAESGLFGYGLGPEVKDFYASLKTIDSKITQATLLANDPYIQACKCKGRRNRLAKTLREKTARGPRRICKYRYVIYSAYIRKFSENRDADSLYLESRVGTTRV